MADPEDREAELIEIDAMDAAPEESPAAEGTEQAPRRSARGALILSARIVTGAIGVGIAAVVLAAATWLPLPTHTVRPPSSLVVPVSTDQQLVCAGSLLRLGDDRGQGASSASAVGTPAVSSAVTAGTVSSSRLDPVDATVGQGPQVLTVPARQADALFAASQVQQAASGDIFGLAAAECAAGQGDSWLVGGATVTGRTTLLTLANPSDVTATVALDIYAETGLVPAAGTTGIVVPAGAQRVFSLAAFAPGVISPVVHVQSRGGQVIANLQQSVVRTLEPGGVDIVGVTAAPSTLNVIPGLVVANSDAVIAQVAAPGYGDLASVIRLYAPSGKKTTAGIIVTAENGGAPGKAAKVTVEAGRVTEFPLGALADGNYTVTITSAEPLVAAARVSTIGSIGLGDFAWLAAAPPVAADQLIVVVPGPFPVLHAANPTDAPLSVTLVSAAGNVQLALPAGSSVVTPVLPGSYRASGGAGARLSVSYLADGGVAAFQVNPAAPVSTPIRVFP